MDDDAAAVDNDANRAAFACELQVEIRIRPHGKTLVALRDRPGTTAKRVDERVGAVIGLVIVGEAHGAVAAGNHSEKAADDGFHAGAAGDHIASAGGDSAAESVRCGVAEAEPARQKKVLRDNGRNRFRQDICRNRILTRAAALPGSLSTGFVQGIGPKQVGRERAGGVILIVRCDCIQDCRVLPEREVLDAGNAQETRIEFEDPLQEGLAHSDVDRVAGDCGNGVVKGDVGGDEAGRFAAGSSLTLQRVAQGSHVPIRGVMGSEPHHSGLERQARFP